MVGVFFFFKQKTAYEISSRDWSSDVCSSDLEALEAIGGSAPVRHLVAQLGLSPAALEGRSEERRVGKECVSLCRARWLPCPEKKKERAREVRAIDPEAGDRVGAGVVRRLIAR